MLCALLSLVDLPCAVDGPVSQVAVAGKPEGTRCCGMRQKVTDQFFAQELVPSSGVVMLVEWTHECERPSLGHRDFSFEGRVCC